jgi:hypothetical protein
MFAVAVVVALIAVHGPLSGQAQEGAASTTKGRFEPPRTTWGDPDLQGFWLPAGGGKMETPSGKPWHTYSGSGADAAFSSFFEPDRGARPQPRRPAPPQEATMVVDPPDGRIPLQPWAMKKREEIVGNQDKVQFLDPRVRCLQSGVPRANLPVGYNTYQFVQIPGYVVLLYEWNHMTRYIPLDGRPHVSPKIRSALGDSRGRWEGNTLVVDVTNFTDRTWVVGHGAPPEGAPASALISGHGVFHTEALHVVERYTLADANTIRYEATIEDPNVFTRPWKIDFNAFKRAPADHQLYEYACHEGNGRNVKLMTGVDIDGDPGTAAPAKK